MDPDGQGSPGDRPEPPTGRREPRASAFGPVCFERGLVVSGGAMPKKRGVEGYGVPVTPFEVEGQVEDLVRVEMNHYWLLKVVGGEGAIKGDLKESGIVDLLRGKVKFQEPDEAETPPPQQRCRRTRTPWARSIVWNSLLVRKPGPRQSEPKGSDAHR